MDKKLIFQEFISKNEILIVDKNGTTRNRLLKTLTDLGAKKNSIHTTSNLSEALEIVESKNPSLVLSEYAIGGGSGFELFKKIREKNPENKQLSLILVTSNISQTAVAKAAEEDVDSFIIKPFTLESIQNNLISTIAQKILPSEYLIKIEEGKNLIKASNYDEAIIVLEAAIPLHSKPALALFYIGQAEYLKSSDSKAQVNYDKGLAFNSIHFKCLIGLYDIFMQSKKFHEAYAVVKRIARYFPSNPDRLAEIVRLTVQTENFTDMPSYYNIFTSIEERTDSMIKYMGAGLYVSGKHSLLNSDIEAALKCFDSVAVSCSVPRFIKAIISVLVRTGSGEYAEQYLSRFAPENREGEDFLISNFLVDSVKKLDHALLVKKGLHLHKLKIRDFMCMKIMVDAMIKCDFNKEKIAEFESEIALLWPEKVLPLSA